jgi:hypothetical protein
MAQNTQTRELYLGAAEAVAKLLAAPEVATAWREPSALPKLSVQGLAGHLAGQIFFIPAMLAEPIPTEPVIPIHEYYAQVSWIGSGIDSTFNQAIRAGGEQDAAGGPGDLAERVAACVEELRVSLPATTDRVVRRPTWGPWSISSACPESVRARPRLDVRPVIWFRAE